MAILLGTAKPDCDYKDPKSILIVRGQEGCPRQAQFRIWIQNVVDGAFKDKQFHACRTHAPVLFQKFMEVAKEMRRLKEKVKVMVVDLDLEKDKKKKPFRVLVQKQEKGKDLRKLNAFLGRKH